MAETVIELINVTLEQNGASVLHDVNVQIQARDFVGIVGPNGGGKTTLLRIMLGLIKPSKGDVKLLGEDPSKTRHRAGYVPQHIDFDPMFPATVQDVVLTGRLTSSRLFGRYTREDKTHAAECLDKVGLESLIGRSFNALSGGERQRVLIARALASDPEILFLDEPTSNVDADVGNHLYSILGELNKNVTIALVSHDLAFVGKAVKSILCVNHHVNSHTTCAPDPNISKMLEGIYGQEVKVIDHSSKCQENCSKC